jgi:hypothetical protein
MVLLESEPQPQDIVSELLDISTFVLSTCDFVQTSQITTIHPRWNGQTNPHLAIEASINRPFGNSLGVAVMRSTMLVEYPDFGSSLVVTRGVELDQDDPIATFILDNFREHYRRYNHRATTGLSLLLD